MSQHRLHLAGRAAIVAMLFMAVATSAETPLEPTVEKPRPRPPAAAKPSPHPLTLQDAIHRALQHNLALAAARLSPHQAATVVVEERAAFDPAAFGEFNRRKANQQARSALFGEREQNGDAAFGLRKRFPLGTEAEAFYGLEKDWNDAPFATTNPAYRQGHGAQFVQPLLKGFGIRVNTAAIATARNDQRIALAALHDAALQTIAETVRMYWELAYAHGNRTFLLDSLERTRNLQRDIEARVRAEVLGGRDPSVAQAAAGVAVAQEAVISADDAIRDVEDSLKVLTDLGADDVLWGAPLMPTTPPPTPTPTLDLQRALLIALDKRPDYRQIKITLENDDIQLHVTRHDLLPRLDLTARAASAGLADDWHGAGHHARSLDFYDLSVGLVFEYPLGNRAATARRRRASLRRQQDHLRLKFLERQIQRQVREAVRQVGTDTERLRAATLSVRAQQERLRAENIRLKEANVGTSQDVLDAVAALASAQSRRLRALVDLNTAVMETERAQGTLLEAHGVTITDTPRPR